MKNIYYNISNKDLLSVNNKQNVIKTSLLLGLSLFVFISSASSISNIGYLFVLFQILLFSYLLLFKSYLVLPYLILTLGSSIEFSTFINNGESRLYNISNSKILNFNLGVWEAIIIIIFNLLKTKLNIREYNFNYRQYIILVLLILMFLVSTSISFVNYFIDSELSRFNISYLLGILYLQFWPLTCFFLCLFYIKKYKNGLFILKLTILYTFLSVLISSLILNFLGFKGTYGDSIYYFSPTLIFIAPLILVIFKDPIFNISRKSAIVGFLLLILTPIIFFGLAGGKIIILSLLAIFLYNKDFTIRKSIISILLIIILGLIIYNLMIENNLLKSKFEEITSLFNFISGNWYELLQPSTKFRVNEFINIFNHYKLFPIGIPFGFGVAAGAPDYIAGYGLVADGSFPQTEYNFNYFISYHEISSFFIKYGLLGFFLIYTLVRYSIKFKEKSQFLIVGTIWFLLYWGYSQTLATIGACILAIGVMEIPNYNKKSLVSKFIYDNEL